MGWKWETEPGMGYSRFYKAVVPLKVRRWGGPAEYAKAIPGRMSGYAYLVRYRTINMVRDVQATAAGYCNKTPPEGSGGYPHWRCDNLAGVCKQTKMHRFINYTWHEGAKRVLYDPTPLGVILPRQPWQRHLARTIRQRRAHNRVYGKK